MPSEKLPPPSDLAADGKKLWRVTRDQLLEDHGELPVALLPTLERYVRAAERAREARESLNGELTATGSQGQLVQHPNVKTAREAEQDAHRYAEALLLTPAARRRYELESRSGERDPLGEALA